MTQFKNKTAVVSGGASGIGRALCLELARRGAMITVADINAQGADQTVNMIRAQGGRAESVVTDMRDPDAVARLVDTVAEKSGLDYMFNNAGVIMFGEFRDMAYEDWRHFIDSDVMSVIYGTSCAYRVMIKQGHGHIVNISSVFGLFPFALGTGYSAVKQAVVGLTLSLRPEASDLGVRVSVACPGSVKTEVRRSYKIINGDRDRFNALIMKELTPEAAALKIIKGVERNKGLIAFPLYDLWPWWLFRLNSACNYWWQRLLVKLFRRKVRNPD